MLWCRHKWVTVSIEEKPSQLESAGAAGFTKLSNMSAASLQRVIVIHQECSKCGKARLEAKGY